MPVRSVSNRGRKNIIGKFPSLKLGRMVTFESGIERDFISLLDYTPIVARFEEQPLAIEYEHEGKMHTYTPDFLIAFRNGRRALVECKPQKFVGREENRRKFQAARAWCAGRGWTFHVATDEQIRAGYRVENIKLLTQHARHEPGTAVQQTILNFLQAAPGCLTIADALNALIPTQPTSLIMPILHMAYYHRLYIPLNDAPITAQSPIAASPFCLHPVERERNEYREIFYG